MKVIYIQNGERIEEDCRMVEFANDSGDILISFSDDKNDYLIIDKLCNGQGVRI